MPNLRPVGQFVRQDAPGLEFKERDQPLRNGGIGEVHLHVAVSCPSVYLPDYERVDIRATHYQ